MKEYRGLQYPELSDLFKGGSEIRETLKVHVHGENGEIIIDTKNGVMTKEETEELCKSIIDKLIHKNKV